MTVMVKLSGDLQFTSAPKARTAAEAFQMECWDFCEDLLEIDSKAIRFERTTDVPSDGLEGFEDAFIALAARAKSGRIRLDWRPEGPSKISKTIESEVDLWEAGLSHIIYPKGCLLVGRMGLSSDEPWCQSELVVAFRREAKYAKRYTFITRKRRIVEAQHEGTSAICINYGFAFISKAAAAFAVALFDADRQEITRLFAGELMCSALAFSPDGRHLAGAAYKERSMRGGKKGECVLIWELATGKVTKHKLDKGKTLDGISWKDDQTVASGRKTRKLA